MTIKEVYQTDVHVEYVTTRLRKGFGGIVPAVCDEAANLIDDLWQAIKEEVERKVDAHELWAAAQLMPGEGIEDGVARIKAILKGVKE